MAQELNIRLNGEDKKPLYRQIYEYIRREIRSGALEAGERLPSTRALASGLHVARSTAELAYSQLLSEGYIRAKKNSGYYVNEIENLAELHFEEFAVERGETGKDSTGNAAVVSGPGEGDRLSKTGEETKQAVSVPVFPTLSSLGRQGVQDSGLIDFSLRHTEMSVFPYSTWKKITREVMVDANSEMFSHSEPRGDLSLRTTIAHYLHFSRGVRCTPEQVIVGAGNDYLLMLLRHILGEGRRVAMENPSYLRAAQIFASFGYEICPVRMDDDGMLPGSVTSSGADLVYAMPAHQFPVGCIMPVGRRASLLGWATDEPERYIIEDDYDSEFRYRGKPIPALQSIDHAGRVIYIGTFSKAIAPAIRISYMILPPELLTRYRKKCWFFSSTVSRIDQRILNEFMKNGHFERHLNRMRSLYRARHDELLAQLRPLQDLFRILGAGTGLHLVLEALPETAARIAQSTGFPGSAQIEEEIVRRAAAHGVAVYAISDYLLPAPAGSADSASAGSADSASAGRDDSASAGSADSAPAGSADSASAGRDDSAPAGRNDSAPAGSADSAPAGRDDSAPAGSADSAPAGRADSAPAGSSDKASSETDGSFVDRRRPAVLLGFGALDEASICEGVRRLSEALDFDDASL